MASSDKDEMIICSGCVYIVISLVLIGLGIYGVELHNKFVDATITECSYDSTNIIDCTGSEQCGKMRCECDGHKGKYIYDVYAGTSVCDVVFYSSECKCDNPLLGIIVPDALKSDGNWHGCSIYNCENDGFTFDHPDSIEERYIIFFIIGGIVLMISCIWTTQLCVDYIALCKGFCPQNDTKKEAKHHRIDGTIP
eukprot:59473_1